MTRTTETIRNLDAARMAIHDDCRQGCMTDWEYRQAAATAREMIETCRKIATRIYVGVRETAIDLTELGVSKTPDKRLIAYLMIEALTDDLTPSTDQMIRAYIAADFEDDAAPVARASKPEMPRLAAIAAEIEDAG